MKKISLIIFLILFSYGLFADVTITTDSLKLVVKDYDGNISLYTKNEKGNFVPLLDVKQFSQYPSFYISIDGNVYPVNTLNGFDISSSTNASGTEVTFTATLKNVVRLSVKYSFFATEKGFLPDAIRVSPSVVSLSDTEIEVGLKAMFDTMLGENTNTHFTSSTKNTIVSEMMFTDFNTEKWIRSKNDDNFFTVIFPSTQKNILDRAIIAGKKILYTNIWDFSYTKGRSFNSLNSYNNSALCLLWNTVPVGQNSVNDYEFYLYTGIDDSNLVSLVEKDIREVYIDSFVTETTDTKTSLIETIIKTSNAVKNNEIQLTDKQLKDLIDSADSIIYESKNAVLVAQSTNDEILLMKSLIDIVGKMKTAEEPATYEELVALNLLLDQMLEKAEW